MTDDKPKSDEEPKPIPTFLESVFNWREEKSRVVAHTVGQMGDTVELADAVLKQHLVVHQRVGPLPLDDPRIAVDFMLMVSHGLLFNALDLIVQRQIQESMAVLRPAIELAAEAVKIGENPKLAYVWLKRDEDEDAFNKAFKPQFPPGHRLTGALYNGYNMTTKWGSHGGPNQMFEALNVPKAGVDGAIKYFCEDDGMVRRFLFHFTFMSLRILRAYTASLQPLVKEPFQPLLDVWKTAVEVHVHKYRYLFPELEKDKEPMAW